MDLSKQNLLFFSRSNVRGGTENVILQLCEIFDCRVNKIVILVNNTNIFKDVVNERIKVYSVSDLDDKNPQTVAQIIKKLNYVLKKEEITVIHTHHRMAAFYIELTGAYKKRVFINTSHNTFYNKRVLTRLAYRHANLIACGEMVKKNLNNYFGLEKVKVIHNAVKPFDGRIVSEKIFDELKKEGYFIVGNIGRLSEQKGMEYYIRAIPQVREKHPKTKFFIIGSGDDERKLRDLANSIKADVIFLGYRADVQNLMKQLDLIVLSSLWEGLPLTPIEAFSVGKTIVATAVDGTVEIVKDGDNGILIDPRDPMQISNAICRIIEHPEENEKMCSSALETYNSVFSFDMLAESYINYFENI